MQISKTFLFYLFFSFGNSESYKIKKIFFFLQNGQWLIGHLRSVLYDPWQPLFHELTSVSLYLPSEPGFLHSE